jgi:hypothetical protein
MYWSWSGLQNGKNYIQTHTHTHKHHYEIREGNVFGKSRNTWQLREMEREYSSENVEGRSKENGKRILKWMINKYSGSVRSEVS